MLIDVGLPAICVILPPAPSLLQEDSSDACVSIDALASAAERLRSDGLSGNNPLGRIELPIYREPSRSPNTMIYRHGEDSDILRSSVNGQ